MAENEKNFLIVDTDEAGQVIGMRRMETGDTISNDRLNTDIRDAGTNASAALDTANDAQLSATAALNTANTAQSTANTAQSTANDVAASTVNLSGYITDNQSSWETGIDATTLGNIIDASNAIADFSGASGTLSLLDSVGASQIDGSAVTEDKINDAAVTIDKIAPNSISNAKIKAGANIAGSKLADKAVSAAQIDDGTITNTQLAAGAAVANIGTGGITNTQLATGAAVANIGTGAIIGSQLADNAVSALQIADNTVSAAQIATDAGIIGSQIANGTLDTDNYKASSITNAKIKLNAGIEGIKLAANTVSAGQIADGTITNTQLATGAAVANIGTGAIIGSQLANNAVSAAQIANNTITNTQIASNTITNAEILGNTIRSNEIAPNTITTSEISNTAGITGSQIANNTITSDELDNGAAIGNIDPGSITSAALSAGAALGNLADGTITGSKIADGTIDTDNYKAGSITNAKIKADAAIQGSKFADNTVSAGQIADNTITNTQIAAGTITNAELNSAAGITNDQLAGGITNSKLDGNIALTKLANVTGPTILGRQAGTGAPGALSDSIARTTLGLGSLATRDDSNKIFAPDGAGGASAVFVSGAGPGDLDPPVPDDGAVMVIDTTAGRIRYRDKINGTRIEEGTIPANGLVSNSITNAQLATDVASDNISIGGIALNQVVGVGPQTIMGNSEATLNGPMEALTKAQARNILGVSAGTVAPTSPSEGDLWYDTTTGVDELFAYDSGRGKWLSTCTRQYYFARNAAATTVHSLLGPGTLTYNTASRIGYYIPYDMTVVGYAWNMGTATGTTTDWTHRIMRYDITGAVNTSVHDINPTGTYGRYIDMTLNVDYDADGVLGTNMNPGGSATSVQHQTVTIFMKRRTS